MPHLILPLTLGAMSLQIQIGPSSTYSPGDGHNVGVLACGRNVRYTRTQEHIAHRRWRKLGCGRPVLVWTPSTGRATLTKVMDGGPYGIVNKKGDWGVWTRSKPPPDGWRYRGLVDLSWALWLRLGRPRFLSKAVLLFVSWPKPSRRDGRCVL